MPAVVVVVMAPVVVVAMVMVMTAAAGMAMVMIMLGMMILVAMACDMKVVVTVVVMVVAMGMTVVGVTVAMAFIGTAFGLERPRNARNGTAQSTHHLGQDVVIFDVDRLGGDLGRRMAIADVPSDLGEPVGRLGADLEKGLRSRDDADQSAVFELERVAALRRGRLLQVEQKLRSLLACESHATAMAPLVVERDGIDDLVGFHGKLSDDGGGADHVVLDGDLSRT